MRIVITGGYGFLGTSFIRLLGSDGRRSIRVLDDLRGGGREDLSSVCESAETSPKEAGAMVDSAKIKLVVGTSSTTSWR